MSKRVITINRMLGSNGRLIGKALAEELGFAFYDKELIDIAAEKEDCVIVGRCANHILDNKCLSVFIHAPFEYRVQTIIERTGREEKSAQKLVKKVDKERRTYYEYFTDKKWKDISQYHLAFDSSKFEQDKIIQMIKMAL